MPDAINSPHDLIVRGIEAVESNKGALGAVEKSLDGLKVEVQAAGRSATATEGYLKRIAEAEEARLKQSQEQEQRRDAWMARLWSSGPVQMFLVLLLAGLLNALGLSWMAETYLKQNIPVPLEVSHEP